VSARDRRLAHDALETAATELAVLVLGLLTGVITARLLGPHDRGLLSLLGVLPTTLGIFVKLGIGPANVYFLRRERTAPGPLVANSLVLAVVLGGLCVAFVLLFQDRILASILRGATAGQLALLLPLVPVTVLQSYLFGILQGSNQFRTFNRRSLFQSMATLVGMAAGLWVFHFGLVAALVVTVSVQILTTLWVLWTVLRLVPARTVRPERGLMRRTLGFGLKSHVQLLVAHLHARIDLYMLAAFLAPADVAFYAIATRLAELIFLLPQSLGVALYPRLAGRDPADAHALTARACRLVLGGVVPAAVVLIVGGQWVIPGWYGADYAPAVAPLRLLVPATCFMSLYFLLSRNFTSRNRQEVNLLAAGVALGGNVALNLVLIPRLGIVGAAASSAISYGLAAVILVVAFLRTSGLGLREMLVPRPAEVGEYLARTLGRAMPREAQP
jgi:O-antigen/teichoic acid export membrane protein